MRFYLQKHVTRPKEYAYMHDFRARLGAESEELVLSLRGRTVPTAAEPEGRLWMLEPIRRQLLLSCDHLERRFMPRYAEALAQHRPTWIEAFPSALYPLARWLARNPLPEFTSQVKGVMLFSETVHDAQLEAIRAVFPCPVIAHYGHSERVLMAGDAARRRPLLLLAPVRPLRAARRARPSRHRAGTHRLHRRHELRQPGDAVRALPHRRPRGALGARPPFARRLPRLRPHPRPAAGVRGLRRPPAGVDHHAGCRALPELEPAEAIQYEQHEPGRIQLKVAAEKPLGDAALERIARAVERKTQGGCEVEAIQVPRIDRTARGKARMIVQHLDVRQYFGATGGE
jgi:phenylacetate-CoA ligase